jgi:hypothetical protein
MAGHSRSKNGVASLAYVPAISIHVATPYPANRDARHKAGHDEREGAVFAKHFRVIPAERSESRNPVTPVLMTKRCGVWIPGSRASPPPPKYARIK